MSDWAILASGPSMSQEVADSVRGLNVIAVSNTYELAPWADVLVSNDRRWWTNYPKAMEFAGEKVCGLCIEPPKGVTKFAGAMSGSNSGLLAVMVAVKKGATRVLLFGFDMAGSHYFGDHPTPLMNPSAVRFKKFRADFAAYKPKGVEIINCTPGSALRCYKFGDAKEFLPQREPEPEPVIEKELIPVEPGPPGQRGPPGERGPRGLPGAQGPIGPMPDHQWEGTKLRFEEPADNGTKWGKFVELRGPEGPPGASGGRAGGGSGGEGMTPLQALQLQTLLDIFGGWIAAVPVPVIDEVAISDLEVNVEGSATGFYPTYPFTTFTPLDVAWEWDWGDGTAHATTQDAAHSYAAAGTYTIRFRAHNHIGWSDWVEENVIVSEPSGGTLSLAAAVSSSAVDLTAMGTIDWKYFANTDGSATQEKSGGSGIGDLQAYSTSGFTLGGSVTVSWTDGTPDASGSGTGAIYKGTIDNTTGAQMLNTVAGTTEMVLRLGVAGYNGRIFIDASLSDDSAPDVVGFDTGIVAPDNGQVDGYVDITFKASSAVQTLTWRAWMVGSLTPFMSAVTIQSAALRLA